MNNTPTAGPAPLDVIVVGAGQAGLAIGHYFAQGGLSFVLLEAGGEVGHTWRNRWDSLRLFSPAQYDSLPGMPFPAPADSHPSKDDVADYLASYAERFDLPVRLNSPVLRTHREQDGNFVVTTPSGELRARQVVVATGPFQTPRVPAAASELDRQVQQLHSADYRNPGQVLGTRVLVVGAANSGLQIADELAPTHTVSVSVGSKPLALPHRIAGRDLFFWLTKVGFFKVAATSRLARRLRARGDLVIGTRSADLRRAGIGFRTRLTGFTGDVAQFADGTTMRVDAVVWATGFASDYSWLEVPGVIVDRQVRHQDGVTQVPGLYFLGLPWQTSRGSALLGFVGADAAALSARIVGAVRAAQEAPAVHTAS
ncbi:NAD(P)/FAD-dependent oxidoreductase [Phycicoccus sp. Soil748]|uniref:flavin-containing monooxygenase n=1 Tax=Phycicoccus sp. Soil748 TaxID=1736397 RepID=UPI00070243D9|nr:NAD(P)-binding domain-containing protein [Phycicoccus sp. Soil748]KRE55605.1 pyridine nucleotide-disulfide oxidoreductase [Phycicoccus sp. Soil748]